MNRYRKSTREWCFDYQTFKGLNSEQVVRQLRSHPKPTKQRVTRQVTPDNLFDRLRAELESPIITVTE